MRQQAGRNPCRRALALLGPLILSLSAGASGGPDCSRPLSLALHDHGLLYSADTGTGIDRDVADELQRRSGCKIHISLLPRARIWQLIETGALDFSLSGISNAQRDKFADLEPANDRGAFLELGSGCEPDFEPDF